MNYRPNYRVSTLVFALLTFCFAFAYYQKTPPVIERIVYLPTNAAPLTIIVTNAVTYTNMSVMLTNTTIMQTTIHTNLTVDHTNTVIVYTNAPAPAPIVSVITAPEKSLDSYFSDDVGLRPILATNTFPSTGMSEITFSLTWNPADQNSLRVALIPTMHLLDNTAEIISLTPTENLARITRRFVDNQGGSTNKIPVYSVVLKHAVHTEPPPPIVKKATPEQEPQSPVVALPSVIVNSPAPEVHYSLSPSPVTSVRVANGTWVNSAHLPPQITVDNPWATYPVGLTDYTVALGTWWGVRQNKYGTEVYYPDNDGIRPTLALIDPHTVRVTIQDSASNTIGNAHFTFEKKANKHTLALIPVNKDALKIGVAFLREETRNGWIDPPMTLAMHPELHQRFQSIAQTPDTRQSSPPSQEVKRKAILSPKALSQVHVRMRR